MKTAASIFFLFACMMVSAQKSPIYQTKNGAIRGYDPVAYFNTGEPTKGSEEFTFKWKDATWYFSSQVNLDVFKKEPEKYAPQFGGYCAYAVSQGYTYEADPNAWKIVDGKLYLNYDKGVQKKWEANRAEHIKKAEANWPKIVE